MRGSTNKSPIKLNAAEIKFDTGNLFLNGETTSTIQVQLGIEVRVQL